MLFLHNMFSVSYLSHFAVGAYKWVKLFFFSPPSACQGKFKQHA